MALGLSVSGHVAEQQSADSGREVKEAGMTDEQIKHMVDRFLGWKLPRDNFNPDCGISFDKEPFNTHTPYPSRYEPTGTNLFSADQAEAMMRYITDGLPDISEIASQMPSRKQLVEIAQREPE